MRRVIHIPSGETALAKPGLPGSVLLQFDRFDRPQSHGWSAYPETHVLYLDEVPRPVGDTRPVTQPATSGQSDDGFAVALATGIPIPLTPMSVAGAVLHNTIHTPSPSYDTSSPPPSYDPGPSYSGE